MVDGDWSRVRLDHRAGKNPFMKAECLSDSDFWKSTKSLSQKERVMDGLLWPPSLPLWDGHPPWLNRVLGTDHSGSVSTAGESFMLLLGRFSEKENQELQP